MASPSLILRRPERAVSKDEERPQGASRSMKHASDNSPEWVNLRGRLRLKSLHPPRLDNP
jgi:hypothetical protein